MSDRRRELDAILQQALDLDPGERTPFLDGLGLTPDDRARVERLLESAEDETDFLAAGSAMEGPLRDDLARYLEGDGETPPDTVPGYTLVRRIGSGGMSEVWEGEQTEPVARSLAIKLVRPGMESKEVLARFVSERQTLAHMNHPDIAQVFDAGLTASGRPYFAMELVHGSPVTDYVEAAGLSLKARLRLFCRICDAVHHAHQKGVIHRDLKPSNVLVTEVDGKPRPKVIDFGIARAVAGPLSGGTLMTEAGQIIGTPEYMSPEQAGDDPGDVDTRSDVYALGVLLYELLTGSLPLARSGSSPSALADLLRQIRESEPVRPSRKAPGSSRVLRGDLDWITMKALSRDRNRRYGSAAEFAEDVRRHLRDEPVAAGPPSAAYRAAKFARRNATLLTAAAAVLIALVAGLIGTWTGLVRSRTEAAISSEINRFLNEDLLAAVAPEARGRDVTVREVLDAAGRKLDGRFTDQPEVAASLRKTIGDTYMRLGRFDDASPHLEQAAVAFEQALGAEHPRTLDTVHALAELRFYQGRAAEAEPLLERVVRARTRLLGPDDVATLSAVSDLGAICQDQGKLDQAERHYRAALDAARRILPPEDPQRFAMLHNLGALLRDRARYDEAEAILREAWEGSRSALGAEHPDTLSTLSVLGGVLRESGNLKEAAPIYLEVFQIRRRILGDEHLATLLSANNLAMLHADLEEFDEAERWQRLALNGQLTVLGEDHDSTILSWTNLGSILTRAGRPDEALPVLVTAVTRARSARGDRHPLTGKALWNHGRTLVALERFDEAVPVLQEARATLAAALGADHPETVRVEETLARLQP